MKLLGASDEWRRVKGRRGKRLAGPTRPRLDRWLSNEVLFVPLVEATLYFAVAAALA